jgi:hypothetical protein
MAANRSRLAGKFVALFREGECHWRKPRHWCRIVYSMKPLPELAQDR